MDVKCVFFVCPFFPPPPLARDRIAQPRQGFSPELCRKAIAATHYEAIITLRMADALREAAAAGISTSEAKSREDAKDNLLLHNALHVVHVH